MATSAKKSERNIRKEKDWGPSIESSVNQVSKILGALENCCLVGKVIVLLSWERNKDIENCEVIGIKALNYSVESVLCSAFQFC